MFGQIQELITSRDYKKAERAIANLLRTDLSSEDSATLFLLRAKARLLSGRPSEAIHDWKQAEEISRIFASKLESQELLADSYLSRYETASVGFAQKSDVREASQIFQKISSKGEEYANIGWVYYQQGRIALIEGQSYAAETYFHKALFNPSTESALTAYCYERLGFVAYYESRQSKKALIFLDKALDTYPISEPRLWLVQVYLLKSRVQKNLM